MVALVLHVHIRFIACLAEDFHLNAKRRWELNDTPTESPSEASSMIRGVFCDCSKCTPVDYTEHFRQL